MDRLTKLYTAVIVVACLTAGAVVGIAAYSAVQQYRQLLTNVNAIVQILNYNLDPRIGRLASLPLPEATGTPGGSPATPPSAAAPPAVSKSPVEKPKAN